MIETNANDIITTLQNISIKDIDKAIKKGIRTGLNNQKRITKSQFLSVLPKANKKNPKYNDKLADAIKVSKINRDGEGQFYGKIHIMGSNKSGSGTFRARFFEGGTRFRQAKTYNGKPLKKNRKLGQIDSTNFFNSSIQGLQTRVNDTIEKELKNMIDKINQ